MGHLLVCEKVIYPVHVWLTLCRDSISSLVHKIKIHSCTYVFVPVNALSPLS